MASVIEICNLALSNVGKENINSLDEASPAARACRQFYAHTRDLLLQDHSWGFAGKTESLAEIENDKPGQWSFAYERPVDCLKVRWVRPRYSLDDGKLTKQQEFSIPYEVEGQHIYCDLSPAFLRFTFKLVDPSLFPALFTDALSWHLAVRLAMPLTKDPKIRADALQVAGAQTDAAKLADANEEPANSDIESEFVGARD